MKILIALWISLAVVVVGPTGCASDPLPITNSSNVDLSDPDKVIANALTAMFTWSPTKDASPDAAYQRASMYLSGGLAKVGGQMSAPGPGSQWDQWRTDGAVITAKVYFLADETPPNSDDVVHRVVVIVQSATTSDNRLIDEIRHTAWVTANKADNRWRVTNIRF